MISHGAPITEIAERQYAVYAERLDADGISDPHGVEVAPALYQEEVEKVLDIRATIVGETVHAAALRVPRHCNGILDWRGAHPDLISYEATRLPAHTAERCLKLTHRLGLRFAAIDMILRPDGTYVFLELNPNGQWGWIERKTGVLPVDSFQVPAIEQHPHCLGCVERHPAGPVEHAGAQAGGQTVEQFLHQVRGQGRERE